MGWGAEWLGGGAVQMEFQGWGMGDAGWGSRFSGSRGQVGAYQGRRVEAAGNTGLLELSGAVELLVVCSTLLNVMPIV